MRWAHSGALACAFDVQKYPEARVFKTTRAACSAPNHGHLHAKVRPAKRCRRVLATVCTKTSLCGCVNSCAGNLGCVGIEHAIGAGVCSFSLVLEVVKIHVRTTPV